MTSASTLDASALLKQANAILQAGGPNANRAACWIGRAALESAVAELIESRQRPAPEATMRSKLGVLQVAFEGEPGIATRAQYAWTALSRVCHHHAFELTPSAGEVEHLLDLVQSLHAATKATAASDNLPEITS